LSEKILHGVAAAGGIAIAPAYLYHPSGLTVPRRSLKSEDIETEVQRYLNAIAKTRIQIGEVADKAKEKLGDEHAAIFKAHQVVLDDPVFQQEIPDFIRKRRLNAEALIHEELEKFKALIADIEQTFPALGTQIKDDDGKLRRFINIYVNDEDIRFLGGETYLFQDGDEIMLIPSIAGGKF